MILAGFLSLNKTESDHCLFFTAAFTICPISAFPQCLLICPISTALNCSSSSAALTYSSSSAALT